MAIPSVFISYSHKDEDWKDRLVTHLGVLMQEKVLDLWEDRRIDGGDDWESEIKKAINRANIAILLISANFLTSRLILKDEVPKLLARREKEGIRILPIIVKPCAWTHVTWLSKLQARPKDGRALSSGNENQIDTDFVLIASEIVNWVENIKSRSAQDLSPYTDGGFPSYASADIHQPKVQRIKDLINFGDYDKAIRECSNLLELHPEQPLVNLLMVISTLKGKGADRYQTKTIQRLEQHLSNACGDPKYYPTALMIWGLIKHDHYILNALHQEKPTLNDLHQSLAKIDIEDVELDLVEKIKAGRTAYESLNLVRFFGEG